MTLSEGLGEQPRVWCFGDSNGAGVGLALGEQPFAGWVARALGLQCRNLAEPGASLGLITQRLIQQHRHIRARDLVLITVPPDSRWYDENSQGFHTVSAHDRDRYLRFLEHKTLRWFQYHHGVFLYTQQSLMRDLGVTWIWLETYGQMRDSNRYGLPLDWRACLADQDCMSLLSGRPGAWQSYPWHLPRGRQFDLDGPQGDYEPASEYFLGTDGHPNEAGHRRLADLILAHPWVQEWQRRIPPVSDLKEPT